MIAGPRARFSLSQEKLLKGQMVEYGEHTFDSIHDESFIAGVTVDLSTDQASEAEISIVDEDCEFLDGLSQQDGLPWAVVRVWLGYNEDLGAPVFKGLLASVDHGKGKTTLRFFDMGFRMRIDQKTEYHKGLDLDVLKKLVTRHHLKFVGPGKGVKGLPLKSRKQEAQTDWELALDLAQNMGLVLFVRGDTLFATHPTRTQGVEPVATFKKRDVMILNTRDFHYNLPENRSGRPRRVEVRGRGRNGTKLSGVSEESKRGRSYIVVGSTIPHTAKSEAARRAQAIRELEREPTFTCSFSTIFQESQQADIRDVIELVDAGDLFSGKYIVDGLVHEFSPGHLTTNYDLVRDAITD